MKVQLAFHDWINDEGLSVYSSKAGIELSSGDFHSGTIFNAGIELTDDEALELKKAIALGFRPVFSVID